jgi:4-amino-4-deoxy-L-arabinose transferase-like glycosyltransferase
LRSHSGFFLLAALSGLVLRLWFVFHFPAITSDSFVYGDIAKNWLQHGIYGITDNGVVVPTYIRLPGYPAFLAAAFSIFGMEHYRAVLAIQVLLDLASCCLMADLARRLVSDRAAKAAFVLAALCPFLANYAAAALTETLEVFFTVLALDFAVAGLRSEVTGLRPWVGSGLATAGAILLRPDGGLLLAAIGGYLLVQAVSALAQVSRRELFAHRFRAGAVFVTVALAPLVPWTLRNLHTLHQFQPLAPRYANAPGEFLPLGFNRWMRTWIVDYASTEEIYWAAPENQMDAGKLPARAFDSQTQREETTRLLDDYNRTLRVTPELDGRFAALAEARVQHSRLRYYVWLPLARITDMWLRPRTELLPSDSRWWEFNDDRVWSAAAVTLGVINLLYLGLALLGLMKGRFATPVFVLLVFVILRSAFLGSLENPETRYTLECFPVVIVLAGSWFSGAS